MKLSQQSLCTVTGDVVASATRPLAAPIYQFSVFDMKNLELAEHLCQGSAEGYIYSGEANPNARILERTVTQFEGKETGAAASEFYGWTSQLCPILHGSPRLLLPGGGGSEEPA